MNAAPIPEDVHQAAVNLADTLILEREVSGQSQEYTDWAVFMISRAIMADRANRDQPSEYERMCKCN